MEFIDILASVRKDATLIGHPVIVFAIKHWQEIIKWQNFHRQSGGRLSKEFEKLLNQKSLKIEDGKKYAKYIVDFSKNKLAFKDEIPTKDISPVLAEYLERVFSPLSEKADKLTNEWIKKERKNKKTLSDDEKRIYCENRRSELTENALVKIYVFRRHLEQQADSQTDRKTDKEKRLKQPTDEMITQAKQYAEENYSLIGWNATFKTYNDENAEKFVKSAKRNLKALGEALFLTVENRTISPQKAFVLQIENLGIEKKETYLDYAWKLLKHLEPTHKFKQRMKFIESFLLKLQSNFPFFLTEEQKKEVEKKENRRFEDITNDFLELSKEIGASHIGTTPISVKPIIDFLKSPIGKSLAYQEQESEGKFRAPTREIFQNRFEEWFLNKTANARKDYKKKALNRNKCENSEQIKPPPFPTYHPPKSEIFQILSDILSAELVRSEKPQIIPSRDVPINIGKSKSLTKLSKRDILIESEKIRQQLEELKKRNPTYKEAKQTPELSGESDFLIPTPR